MKKLLICAASAVVLVLGLLPLVLGGGTAEAGVQAEPPVFDGSNSLTAEIFWEVEGPCGFVELAVRGVGAEDEPCVGSRFIENERIGGWVPNPTLPFRLNVFTSATEVVGCGDGNFGNIGFAVQPDASVRVCDGMQPSVALGEFATVTVGDTTVRVCVEIGTDIASPESPCYLFGTVTTGPNNDAGWVMLGTERQWLSPQCRTLLETAYNLNFRQESWSKISTSKVTTSPLRCEQIGVNLSQGGSSCIVLREGSGVRVQWPDLGAIGYDVYHEGQAPVWVTDLSWLDATPGRNYTVVAWGNGLGGLMLNCRNGGAQPAEQTFVTIPGNSAGWAIVDGDRQWLSPACRAELEGFGAFFAASTWASISANDVETFPRTCDRLRFEIGGFGDLSCEAESRGAATVLFWSDVGASGYDLSINGAPAIWVTGTSYPLERSSNDDTYQVTAWGNGTDGTVTVCTGEVAVF